MNSITIEKHQPTAASRKRLVVTSPFDESVVGDVAINSWEEIEQSIELAASTFTDSDNRLSTEQRVQVLSRTGELMKQQRESFALLATQEGGKPFSDSLVEVDRAIDGLKCCCDVLRTQSGQVIPMGLNAASQNRIAYTSLEPIGPVLAFSAFNHPLNLIVHQVAPAIAAGCPVIVKPAEATPLSCQKFVDLLYESGLPKRWCQVVNADSLDVAGKLVADERLSFFTFVGSARVGWHLRSTLAAGVRCTLEHGGTAPVIIDRNIDQFCELIPVIGKGSFYHAGQVCVSVQKIFVHEEHAKEFSTQLAKHARQLRVGDPLDEKTDVGPLIRSSEVDRIHDWVSEGIESGGDLMCGGQKLENNCYQPTVLFDPALDAKVSQHEIFGPVVCIYPYRDIDVVIQTANSSPFSFQAAVFSDSIEFVNRVTRGINAAAVMVNDHTAFRVDWMPFAGHKRSGLGTGGFAYTIKEMQAEKLIVINSRSTS